MPATRHETFTVPVAVPAPPAAVFAAFAEPERRRRWIRMPGSDAAYAEDFRVGGTATMRSVFRQPGREERLTNVAMWLAIEPHRRLVWTYAAAVDDEVRWASLVTVALTPTTDGTALTWTEQVAFLVASERPEDDLLHVRGGVRLRLNGLPAAAAG